MNRITVVLDVRNKHNNRVYYGNQLIASGQDVLDDVEIVRRNGKKYFAHLSVTGFNLVTVGDECPERFRYDRIQEAYGNAKAIAALDPVCEMIRISPRACDGCPKNPNRVE